MHKTVNIHEAKTTLSKLIAEVEEGNTVFIARAGKTVAKLTAAKPATKNAKASKARAKKIDRSPGFLKGKIKILERADDPPLTIGPIEPPKRRPAPKLDRRPGQMKGKIWVAPNFDDPLPEEILKAFRGESD